MPIVARRPTMVEIAMKQAINNGRAQGSRVPPAAWNRLFVFAVLKRYSHPPPRRAKGQRDNASFISEVIATRAYRATRSALKASIEIRDQTCKRSRPTPVAKPQTGNGAMNTGEKRKTGPSANGAPVCLRASSPTKKRTAAIQSINDDPTMAVTALKMIPIGRFKHPLSGSRPALFSYQQDKYQSKLPAYPPGVLLFISRFHAATTYQQNVLKRPTKLMPFRTSCTLQSPRQPSARTVAWCYRVDGNQVTRGVQQTGR
jgi:hypothetical protein